MWQLRTVTFLSLQFFCFNITIILNPIDAKCESRHCWFGFATMDAASCQNCYICYRETIDGFPMLTKLKYSKSLLFLLINEFLNADQKYRFSRDEIVCEKCMFTLNRYDLAWLTAKCIKQEIKDAVDVTDRTYRQTGNIGFLDPSDDVLSALCESEFNA